MNYSLPAAFPPSLPTAAATAAPTKMNIFSGLSKLWLIPVIIIILLGILIVYHKTIGYYIDYGWKHLYNKVFSKKETVEVDIGEGGEPTLLKAVIKKDEDAISDAPAFHIPTSLSSLENSMKTVYNVSHNIYTYYDAPAVCQALNGTLATYDQVKEAHSQGADWCNYGWVKGQMAVYPTQEKTWEKLQKGKPEFAKSCGKPGVNGGFFDNPELRFGVNCYGIRPPKTALDENIENQTVLPQSAGEIEFDKKVQRYRDNINSISIMPFHGNA